MSEPARNTSPRYERNLELACIFGLEPERAHAQDRSREIRAESGARSIVECLDPGGVALVTGPSGGGKSSILLAVERACASTSIVGARHNRSRRTPISLIRGSVDASLATLSSAGLGDARVAITPACRLSDGEAFRLRLARAMDAHARTKVDSIVIVDEFCSTLDRITARGVARTFTRWVRRAGVRAIVATARDEMIEMLSPQLVCWQGLDELPLLVGGYNDGRADAHTAVGACTQTITSTADRDRSRVA